jgi:peptidyl-prolyl cis-trans isomerase C
LIKSGETRDREAALKLIGEIREKVIADPSIFEQMAREYSEDTGSAAKGGALGPFARKRMVQQFSDAAFELKQQGELSDVVETKFGFHLIRLDKPYVHGIKPYEEVKEQIVKKLSGDIKKLIREEYLISLRDSPDALVNEKNIDAFLKNPLSASGSE